MRASKLLIILTVLPFFGLGAGAETLGRGDTPLAPNAQTPPNLQETERLIIETVNRARATRRPPEGMGLWPVNSPHLPPAVQRAAGSTFRIMAAEGDRVPYAKIFGQISLQQALSRLQAMPLSADFDAGTKEIYRFQLLECVRLKQADCRLFDGISYGTAFVTGDGLDVRTALHIVEAPTKEIYASRMVNRIPMVLIDGTGRIVAGPQELNARIVAIPPNALNIDPYGKDLGKFSHDQVVIRIDKKIAPPIPLASARPPVGQEIFIAGIPKATDDRSVYFAPDSDGISVRVSRGTILSAEQMNQRYRLTGSTLTPEQLAAFTHDGILNTADGTPRLSGAPMLNARGEVLGIYTGGLPQSGAVFPFRISNGGSWLLKGSN